MTTGRTAPSTWTNYDVSKADADGFVQVSGGTGFTSGLIYITRKNGSFFPDYGRVLHDQCVQGTYTDKDGKNPTLTKFGQQAMTGDHANLKVSAKLGGSSYDDGYSKLNFKAVSQNDIDPNTGEAYNPLLWKSNQDETELFKDWSAHMENATNDIDYLQKAGKLSIAAGASYTTPQEDSTVSATRSSVKSETVNASWQAITAAGKFEKTLDEARTKIDNLGYKEVLKVDQQNAKDLIQARKDIVKQAK